MMNSSPALTRGAAVFLQCGKECGRSAVGNFCASAVGSAISFFLVKDMKVKMSREEVRWEVLRFGGGIG